MFRVATVAALVAVSLSTTAFSQEFVAPGTELAPGDEAVVPFLVPNGPEVPIEVKVTEIAEGSIDDLSGFDIPPEAENARPYYVRYAVTNVSDEDLSNQQTGAFVAFNDAGEALMPSITMGGEAPFTQCQDLAARDLAPGASHEGCVMFLLPEGATMTGAGYRGNYRYEEGKDTEAEFPIYYDPVVWRVADAASKPKAGKVVMPQS